MHLHGPRSRAEWLFLGSVAFFAGTNFLMFPSMLCAGQSTDVVAILADVPVDWESLVAMPAIHVGVFAGLAASMLIARKLGYRLQWGRQ